MKIISGRFKGRTIAGYHLQGTRPTMDRVKESMFSMIQAKVPDSLILDLFAGSGSLGFEALSRGAKHCCFVDHNPKCIKQMKKTADLISCQDLCTFMLLDYQRALTVLKEQKLTFSLVFLDPPYEKKILPSILVRLREDALLANDGIVIVEMEENYFSCDVPGFIRIKEKKYGSKYVALFCLKSD